MEEELRKEKTRSLCYAYALIHFRYCPILWMPCNKSKKLIVNRTHERAFLSLNEQLTRVCSVTTQNLRILTMLEVFKFLNHLNTEFIYR